MWMKYLSNKNKNLTIIIFSYIFNKVAEKYKKPKRNSKVFKGDVK